LSPTHCNPQYASCDRGRLHRRGRAPAPYAPPVFDRTDVIVSSMMRPAPYVAEQGGLAAKDPGGIGTLPAGRRGARTPPPEICAYLEGVQFRFPTAYRVTRLFARDIGVSFFRPSVRLPVLGRSDKSHFTEGSGPQGRALPNFHVKRHGWGRIFSTDQWSLGGRCTLMDQSKTRSFLQTSERRAIRILKNSIAIPTVPARREGPVVALVVGFSAYRLGKRSADSGHWAGLLLVGPGRE
jgi:hypothetical protein